jgi:hypothetical protein
MITTVFNRLKPSTGSLRSSTPWCFCLIREFRYFVQLRASRFYNAEAELEMA